MKLEVKETSKPLREQELFLSLLKELVPTPNQHMILGVENLVKKPWQTLEAQLKGKLDHDWVQPLQRALIATAIQKAARSMELLQTLVSLSKGYYCVADVLMLLMLLMLLLVVVLLLLNDDRW